MVEVTVLAPMLVAALVVEGERTAAVAGLELHIEAVENGVPQARAAIFFGVRFRRKKDIRCRKGRLLFHTWGRSR